MGAGKSCIAVNKFLHDWLLTSERPIYTNLPLRYVGEVGALRHEPRLGLLTLLLLWLAGLLSANLRRRWLRRVARARLHDWRQRRIAWLASEGEKPRLLQIVANCTRNHARRARMMERIHFLEAKVRQPLGEDGQPLTYLPLDEDGNPVPGAEPQEVGPKHGVREFWYFTKPNAVVFLDEVADIWNSEDRNARDEQKRRPETLNSYIRHHRHYKDDLYFFFQDKEDIDPHLRRKIQYLWTVRNSTKENMFEHWAFRGLRWPVQFFFVKCYLGKSVINRPADSMTRLEPQESWRFWPTRKDFSTYRSFSQAGTLPGKKAPPGEAQSTDFDPSIWGKVRAWVENLGPALAVLGGMAGAVVGALYGLRLLLQLTGSPTSLPLDRTQTPQHGAPAGTAVTDAGNGDFLVTATNAVPAEVERLVLVTPALLRTTKATYGKGSDLGGGRVARFLINGVELEGGRRITFDVLFPGPRGDGGGGGGSDRGPLRGVGAGPRDGDGPQGDRPAGVPDPG